MKLPSPVSPGQPLSAKAFNDLLAFVRSLDVRSGPGIRVVRSAVGTTITATVGGVTQRASSALTHPFQVTDSSSGVNASVTVKTGSVNDSIPTGIDPTSHSLTSAGTWRIYLDCTLSADAAGSITAVAVAVVNGAQPADTRTHAYITLATATVVAITGGFSVSEINQLATHSLRFHACGRDDSVDGSYNFWGF